MGIMINPPFPVAADVSAWEAEASFDIGRFLDRYTRENPPPPGSKFGLELGTMAAALVESGRLRIARDARLRLVEDGAS